jgi:hypothetical protein
MTNDQQKLGGSSPHEPLISGKDVPSLSVPENSVAVLSPTQAPILDEHHAEFAEFEESYIRSYIALADTKAAWTFTISSGLLAFLFSQETTKAVLLNPTWSRENALLLLAAILLILSAFYSFRVVAPRLSSPSGEGVVFFGSVAAEPNADAYVSAVAAKDKRALTEARLKHCFDVSRVCSAKYANLRKAVWLGLPGLVLGVVVLLAG